MATKGENATKFFESLENLNEDQFAKMLESNIDQTLIPVFAEYAQGIFSEVDEEVLSGLVHLMVMSYLVKTNEVSPLSAPQS
jgi:hypothetical protein